MWVKDSVQSLLRHYNEPIRVMPLALRSGKKYKTITAPISMAPFTRVAVIIDGRMLKREQTKPISSTALIRSK